MTYGKEFKKLRLEQDISLEQAAGNAISYSTLSRWENGKSDIRFEDLIHVLLNIHVTLKEFSEICQINDPKPIYNQILQAYQNKNTDRLIELFDSLLKNYNKSHSQYDLFLLATVCSLYQDLTDKNIFPPSLHKKLYYTFSNVEKWTKMYINAFSNSVYLLTPHELFHISSRIISSLKAHPNDLDFSFSAITSIINSYTILIFSDLTLAKKLECKFDKIVIPKNYSYFQIKYTFLKKLAYYRLNSKKDDSEILFILNSLKFLGLEELHDDFYELFTYVNSL